MGPPPGQKLKIQADPGIGGFGPGTARTLLVWLGGPGSWAGPAYTINKLDSDNKVNIMVVYTKKKLFPKKNYREGANLRGSVHQKKVLFQKKCCHEGANLRG